MKKNTLSAFLLLPVVFGLIACDKLNNIDKAMDSTIKLGPKLDEMKTSVKNTNEQMDHLEQEQKLLTTLQSMLDRKNYEKMSPLPLGNLPMAKNFAAVVSAERMVEMTHLYLKEINTTDLVPRRNPTEEDNFEFVKEKFARLQMLQVVSALLPQKTVEDIVERILSGAKYQSAAYSVLMLRYYFIAVGLLEQGFLSDKLDSLGTAEEAFSYIEKMEWIANLAFRKNIKVETIGITGYEDWFQNLSVSLDDQLIALVPDYYSRLATNVRDELDWQGEVMSHDPIENERILADWQSRKALLLEKLETKLAGLNRQ